jgi:DNA primase
VPGYIDFKRLAEEVDIETVANHFGLMLKRSQKELRAKCPACKSSDERALQIIPETNSYRCYAAQESGDVISLYAHIQGIRMYKAAKELQEQFGTAPAARTVPATPPQEPLRRETTRPPKSKDTTFDPTTFAAKLTYTDEVQALGITQEDAERLAIGFYAGAGMMRGRVCFPVRNDDGSIAGFIGAQGSDLKVPKTWLPPSNVVKLKRA